MTRRNAPLARNAGLTLMELMVSVVILVMMVVAFGQILNKSQQVVSGAQKTMRENAAAKAVLATLKEDLRRATANGMLCISQAGREEPRLAAPWNDGPGVSDATEDGVEGRPPRLTLLTAGVMRSKTDPTVGTGGITVLGLAANNDTTDDVLYYQRWVLAPPQSTLSNPTDVWNGWDLARMMSLPRYQLGLNIQGTMDYPNDMNDLVTFLEAWWQPGEAPPQGASTPMLPGFVIPATTPGEARRLWQVLATRVRALSITWTDGSLNDNGTPNPADDYLNWYGIDYTIVDLNTGNDLTDGIDGRPLDYRDDTVVYSNNTIAAPTLPLQNRAKREGMDIDPSAWMNYSAEQAGPDPLQRPALPVRIQYNARTNDAYALYDRTTYRAMWSHHDQATWPKAVRIRFRLYGNPEDPMDPGEEYELICQLGR